MRDKPGQLDRAASLLQQLAHGAVLWRLVRAAEAARDIPEAEPRLDRTPTQQQVARAVEHEHGRARLGIVVIRQTARRAELDVAVERTEVRATVRAVLAQAHSGSLTRLGDERRADVGPTARLEHPPRVRAAIGEEHRLEVALGVDKGERA